MSWRRILGKRTWLGLAAAVASLLLWLMLGALLITRGMLPPELADGWLYGGCALSVLLGGCLAGKGRGERLLPLMVAALLYAVLWIAALATAQPLDFTGRGIWITAAVLGGGLLGCLLPGGGLLGCLLPGGGKRKKRSKSKTYARTKRRKRAVT